VERRFALFLVTTLLVWLTFFALQARFFPPRPPQPQAAKAKNLDKDGGKDEGEGPQAATPQAEGPNGGRLPAAGQPAAAAAEAKAPPAMPEAPRQWVAIGSADPASGFSSLFIFDNLGAALERVELNGSRYKSVEDRSGYLGHLALVPVAGGGAQVQVVGHGTPAALAVSQDQAEKGLAVGDIIRKIDGRAMDDERAVEQYLGQTRPGQRIQLEVQRGNRSLTFTAVLARRPVEIVRPEQHVYTLSGGRVQVLPPDPLSLLLTLDRVGSKTLRSAEEELQGLPSLYRSRWMVERQGPDFVEFSLVLDAETLAKVGHEGPLKIVKRFVAPRRKEQGSLPYHLDFSVRIENLSSQPVDVAYRLLGPTGLPLEGWWYSAKLSPEMWAAAGARDVVWRQEGLGHRLLGCTKIVSDTRHALEERKPPLIPLLAGERAAAIDYAGVDTQFFASVIQPLPQGEQGAPKYRAVDALAVQDVSPIPKSRLRTANVSVRLTTQPLVVPAEGHVEHAYRIFFGPKDPRVLAAYDIEHLIEYGWSIFAVPAKLLRHVLGLLYALTSLVGLANYGVAIVLLTAIVRSAMIPISLKQARAAAKMQELAPEIQRIKARFPDDPLKQHAAIQELYKQHDFNMFSGCLPVFIQLPIFIGLYRCLSVDIDLRDAPLLPGIAWASNLAGPDQLFYWKDWLPAFLADEADGWLGPYFNVFPLITVALFLVQQKMFSPPATDEQTRMQQQMMTFMTVFMGVLFYKVPAGLCLYFITSSLWGICERKLLPRPQPAAAVTAPPPPTPAAPPARPARRR
jgi:YidC/Oxa1 family membrane protein insertase